MEYHPAANIFPMIEGDEFEKLKQDIAINGLLEPITLTKEAKIIDGRNRHRACVELGINPEFRQWTYIGSIEQYVISKNLHRRHLSESQRALIGAKIKYLFEKGAKERQRLNGKLNGGKGKKKDSNVENFPHSDSGRSRDQAAKIVNVSGRSVAKAAQVLQHGAPKLVEKVDNGKISIHLASQIAQLPYKEQIQLLKDPNASIFKRLARNLSRREMEKRVAENQEKEAAALKQLPRLNKRFTLYHADLKNDVKGVPDNSVDLILVDPPYKSRFLKCYEYLGVFGKRVLKHGGSMLVLCGQHHLFDEMKYLNEYLDYYWTISYLMKGAHSCIGKQRQVIIRWKPVLWYVKGKYNGDYISDTIEVEADGKGKNLHKWEQTVEGMNAILTRFSKVGMTVCDPFCGSSSVGEAALLNGCKYIGIDNDEKCVLTSKSRLMKVASKIKNKR